MSEAVTDPVGEPLGLRANDPVDASSRLSGDFPHFTSRLALGARGRSAEHRELERRALRYALRRAYHGFILHRGIDAGAGLTFFSALSLFPATLALVSVVALLDPAGDAVKVILSVIDAYLPQSTLDATRLALEQFTKMPSPVASLVVGSGLTTWAVASYATAFGRAVNSIYGVQEGRRFLKLRLLMLVEAVVLIALILLMGTIVIVTADVAESVVRTMGWPVVAVWIWSVLKWPLLALLAVFTVVVLFYGTPNLKRPRARRISIGATLSIVGWAAMTLGYSYYVSTWSSYDRFYGLLGGAIVTLIYLYLSNLVLVVGAEVDAELTRARQLLDGVEAEDVLQVPVRDSHRTLVLARRRARDLAEGEAIRTQASRLRASKQLASQQRASRLADGGTSGEQR